MKKRVRENKRKQEGVRESEKEEVIKKKMERKKEEGRDGRRKPKKTDKMIYQEIMEL